MYVCVSCVCIALLILHRSMCVCHVCVLPSSFCTGAYVCVHVCVSVCVYECVCMRMSMFTVTKPVSLITASPPPLCGLHAHALRVVRTQ